MIDPALRGLLASLVARSRGNAHPAPVVGPGSRLAPLIRGSRLDIHALKLLALALAPDIDPQASRVITGTQLLTRPTIELAHELLGGTVVTARLGSGSRLRASGLVGVVPVAADLPRPARVLRAPERVVEYLLGAPSALAPELGDACYLDEHGPISTHLVDPDLFELGLDGPARLGHGWSKPALAALARSRGEDVLVMTTDDLGDPTSWVDAWAIETSLRPAITVFAATDLAVAPCVRGWRALAQRAAVLGRTILLCGDGVPAWLAHAVGLEAAPDRGATVSPRDGSGSRRLVGSTNVIRWPP